MQLEWVTLIPTQLVVDGTTEAALKAVLDFIQVSQRDASQWTPVEIIPLSSQEENIIESEPVDERIRLNVDLLTSGSSTAVEEEIYCEEI